MKSSIFLVYDKVSGVHTAPMTFTNENCAIRWFKTTIKENVEDYDLLHVGYYDANTGTFDLIKPVKYN